MAKNKARDEFSEGTKLHLARSVNFNCSKCGAPTAGPFAGGGKSICTGQAAHIRAAAPGGPRFDSEMTFEERSNYSNGIWLCAAHAPLVDRDWPKYSVDELLEMKRRAEETAARNLDNARAQAELRPMLLGRIEWRKPAPNETRPGFQGLHHVVFQITGRRKHRARAFIEVRDQNGQLNSVRACIAEGTERLLHEYREIRPWQPYTIPALNVIERPTKFWLDNRFVPDHPFFDPNSVVPVLQRGSYIADQPFLDKAHRAPLPAGHYGIRVRVVLGDTEHEEAFESEWLDFVAI